MPQRNLLEERKLLSKFKASLRDIKRRAPDKRHLGLQLKVLLNFCEFHEWEEVRQIVVFAQNSFIPRIRSSKASIHLLRTKCIDPEMRVFK